MSSSRRALLLLLLFRTISSVCRRVFVYRSQPLKHERRCLNQIKGRKIERLNVFRAQCKQDDKNENIKIASKAIANSVARPPFHSTSIESKYGIFSCVLAYTRMPPCTRHARRPKRNVCRTIFPPSKSDDDHGDDDDDGDAGRKYSAKFIFY